MFKELDLSNVTAKEQGEKVIEEFKELMQAEREYMHINADFESVARNNYIGETLDVIQAYFGYMKVKHNISIAEIEKYLEEVHNPKMDHRPRRKCKEYETKRAR